MWCERRDCFRPRITFFSLFFSLSHFLSLFSRTVGKSSFHKYKMLVQKRLGDLFHLANISIHSYSTCKIWAGHENDDDSRFLSTRNESSSLFYVQKYFFFFFFNFCFPPFFRVPLYPLSVAPFEQKKNKSFFHSLPILWKVATNLFFFPIFWKFVATCRWFFISCDKPIYVKKSFLFFRSFHSRKKNALVHSSFATWPVFEWRVRANYEY